MTHRLVLLCFLILNMIPIELKSCTTLIAGKNTTKDGSIICAKAYAPDNFHKAYWNIFLSDAEGHES